MIVSENVQMYLVKLAILKEESDKPLINLSALADELDVQTVSANQMIHKLEDLGLVEYQPYKGVSLTENGNHQAMDILRHRRLWEVFLVNKLGYNSETAENLACRIEHVTTESIDNRLAAFLEYPNLSPMGKQIPPKDFKLKLDDSTPLSSLSIGQKAVVFKLPEDKASVSFLHEAGLTVGSNLKVLASNQNNMLIETNKNKFHLAESLCKEIKVH